MQRGYAPLHAPMGSTTEANSRMGLIHQAHVADTPNHGSILLHIVPMVKACGFPQAFSLSHVSQVESLYFLGASTCLGGFMKSAASKKPSAASMAIGMKASIREPLNILLENAATNADTTPPTP